MSDQVPVREFDRSLVRALRERSGAERHQSGIRRVRAPTADGARPQEYDESGFPIRQRWPSFVERVARLLNAS